MVISIVNAQNRQQYDKFGKITTHTDNLIKGINLSGQFAKGGGLQREWDTLLIYNSTDTLLNRIIRTFDGKGNVMTFLIENWQSWAWVNSSRESYTYDTKGNMLTYLTENWQNNAWMNGTRNTNSYDANDNILTYLTEYWQNNAWVNLERYAHS
jgi:hypothetical protein